MRIIFFLILATWFISCKPSRSGVFVETVNAELVSQLIAKAKDTAWMSPITNEKTPGIWVKGLKLTFETPGNTTLIWYDEQDRVTGLVEYKNNVLQDSIHFFSNGQRMFTFLFNKEGKPSGPARFFYEDGRVREDGRFENGIKTGVWRTFKPDGLLEMVNEYDRYGQPKR